MGDSRANAVYRQTEQRLFRLLAGEDAMIRGRLANLRRGAGGRPGDDPHAWGILLSELPDEMLGYRGNPSREEWAIYTALTLYAVHQQSHDVRQENMNRNGISLGGAASLLALSEGGDDEARERVARRFHQVVLAEDMPSMVYYLRTFIKLLRSNDIGLDYPMLARDLYLYQTPGTVASVRLNWGQDFYRKNKAGDNSENAQEDGKQNGK